jgi:hypothetical protein
MLTESQVIHPEAIMLFSNENLDILRYQRDYPRIVEVSTNFPSNSGENIHRGFNQYDQVFSDIIHHFRTYGEVDTKVLDLLENKSSISRL